MRRCQTHSHATWGTPRSRPAYSQSHRPSQSTWITGCPGGCRRPREHCRPIADAHLAPGHRYAFQHAPRWFLLRRFSLAVGATALIILTAAPAWAGGSWLDPTWVRVEAGDHIELSGEVFTGQLGWVGDGPYFAYLSGENHGITIDEGFGGIKTDVPLGEFTIEASGNSAHVSVEFTLPADVPPGEYRVSACNDPCDKGFGDLIGSILFVGMDTPESDDEDPPITVAAASVSTSTLPTTAVSTAIGPPGSKPSVTYLSLAPYPTRNTGLKIIWVAIPAAIAVASLGLVDLARRRL